MPRRRTRSSGLYPRWIVANAVGELLGLGGTFLLAAAALPSATAIDGVAGVLPGFAVLVASGAFEATVLGLAQHRAMRPWFPGLRRAAWWRATLFGALIAYALGYLPSTLMGAAERAGATPPSEPPAWLTLMLAAALGMVAGAILSAFQAMALRRSVAGAGRWIAANVAAWAAGMPVIFLGMDLAFRAGGAAPMALTIAATLLLAGALVGAIHGRTLVRLARAGDAGSV